MEERDCIYLVIVTELYLIRETILERKCWRVYQYHLSC